MSFNRNESSRPPIGFVPVASKAPPLDDGPRLEVRSYLTGQGYTLGRVLGRGSYGTVHVARRLEDGLEVACKIVDFGKWEKIDKVRQSHLPRELYFLRRMHHINLIKMFKISGPMDGKIFVFMEIAEGGDFFDWIFVHGPIPESQAKSWFYQMARGLNYCHREGIAHRDLKCENFLMDQHGVVKITDFGLARAVFTETSPRKLVIASKTHCGSEGYRAPEILSEKLYNPLRSDIWSLGVTFFTLLNNRFPFPDDQNEALKCMLNRVWRFSSQVGRVSLEIHNLLSQMMEPDETKRITMHRLLNHPWFKADPYFLPPE